MSRRGLLSAIPLVFVASANMASAGMHIIKAMNNDLDGVSVFERASSDTCFGFRERTDNVHRLQKVLFHTRTQLTISRLLYQTVNLAVSHTI